ncbi:MAG: hypothetical protein JWO03_2349 [Bacteroidetes bacterium]|nr:hypothetical protein [Bacteroidota bacterium]
MNISYKKTAILFSFIFAFTLLRAQYVSIPDAGWGSWLNANGYSAAMTGSSGSGWNLDTTSSVVLSATSIQAVGDTFISNIDGIQYFKNLTYLRISDDWNLHAVGALPESLQDIDFSQTGLMSVPTLPSGLVGLIIDGTPLNVIPALPNSIGRLWCGYGAAKTFTVLPTDLQDFECASSSVTSLPPLPPGLQYFNCSSNLLTTIPQLPDTMVSLIADHNNLTSLTNLPLYLSGDLYLTDNPGLTCLPSYSYISNLTFTNTAIACLPNYNIGVCVPATTTVPLCSTSNPNGCTFQLLVWPGDANNDRHADNADLLNIGLGYGTTGAARTGASIVWVGQSANDWTDTFLTGLNYKFADCNGDGTIDATDTVAILTNFGLTHSKVNGAAPWRSGTPGIRVSFSADTLHAGDTLVTSFILGDSATPANNISGLAFTYHYDALVTDTTAVSFSFISSWLNSSTGAISISRDELSTGTLKAAITRIDHTSHSGFGTIAVMYARITSDNINGKNLKYYSNLGYISDITAVDAAGHTISLNAGQDSAKVEYTPTGIHDQQASRISIYPNPAKDHIQIVSGDEIQDITVYNAMGQVLLSKTSINKLSDTIDLTTLNNGVYFVTVNTTTNKKLMKLVMSR